LFSRLYFLFSRLYFRTRGKARPVQAPVPAALQVPGLTSRKLLSSASRAQTCLSSCPPRRFAGRFPAPRAPLGIGRGPIGVAVRRPFHVPARFWDMTDRTLGDLIRLVKGARRGSRRQACSKTQPPKAERTKAFPPLTHGAQGSLGKMWALDLDRDNCGILRSDAWELSVCW